MIATNYDWRATAVGITMILIGLAVMLSSKVVRRHLAGRDDPLYPFLSLMMLTEPRPWGAIFFLISFGLILIAGGVVVTIASLTTSRA